MKNLLIILLTLCFVGMCSVSYADYASAHEKRMEQKEREKRYIRGQNRIYDMYELVDYESKVKYRKERRELDLERRRRNNKRGNN